MRARSRRPTGRREFSLLSFALEYDVKFPFVGIVATNAKRDHFLSLGLGLEGDLDLQ